MIVSGKLSTYKVRFSQNQNYRTGRAYIDCYTNDKKIQLLIAFYQPEHESINSARIDNLPSSRIRIVVFFPMHMFKNIHYILQTEKPINVYANNNNDYTQVRFGSEDELIGEEEGSWF